MAAQPDTVPIIDAHHHIWRREDLTWLQGPSQPRIFGDYESIKRDYPIEEYLTDIAGTGVIASVYVQTNWPAGGALREVEWVEEEAGRTGWPHAIVGYANFLDDDVATLLKAQSRFPRMRGIRQQIHWHEEALYRFADRPDIADDPRFRRNLAQLADHGWLFELQLFESQMASGARLAETTPDVTFVLEHAGMLEDLSNAGKSRWRDGMRRLADCPNVATKLSGLGTFIHRNDSALIAEIVAETVSIFGAERCLWGSNFPIEKLWTDYPSLVQSIRSAMAAYGEQDQRAILCDTAARLYGLTVKADS
ncbi:MULTISPECIES: amidohydrolase family protein [unclassified Chelatococcus]|uniref:amidohydrolase family protein n=1 Tax=unclassified Chelatococcus TaxID=2638111 RepID=UPI001BCEA5A7|nr:MULTISPECIES: amidohydrolase family protein [unclassified Chelatococcus]CAH1651367.1 putative TIM-barrel fold metal-dependent hydrolase [Hyphomicrobiales bacterium]MBS7743181.1 amidohydrolase family protein [Chelatococcus sp. HY11]MBX3541701.1 amidohydrolase family protein [Chelatococcus sp.]MCO5074407.1 amidohydrolase family protein [Chelatococcus sp.]CAH1693190.1 putative TIM-barrel fold metal-dependent hydrolase [Hyphomicrobiales bacterium]